MPQTQRPNIVFTKDNTEKNCDTNYYKSNIHTLELPTQHMLGSDRTIKAYAYNLEMEFNTIDDTTQITMYMSYDADGDYLIWPETSVSIEIGQDSTIGTCRFEIDDAFEHRTVNENQIYVWAKCNVDTTGSLKCSHSKLAYIPLLG